MADVLIKFNTVDKQMTVTVDGLDVPDVMEAGVYWDHYDKEAHCMITSKSEDKDHDMVTYKRLVASDGSLKEPTKRDLLAKHVLEYFKRG